MKTTMGVHTVWDIAAWLTEFRAFRGSVGLGGLGISGSSLELETTP